jgi:colanic acid/amylovoran biosynthesis glycosyltransferase
MRLAIISPNKDVFSETFIKAHFDLLRGKKYFLYGSYLPLYYNSKSLVFLIPLYERIIIKYLFKKNILLYSIKLFLRKNRIDIILAEYGPTGCAILDIAKELGIPIVVHFHGYDASSKSLIDEYKQLYKDLFEYAKRIIVVSQRMHSTLISLGANPRKLVINPCGPNNQFSGIIPNYYGSNNILFIGRFVNKKAPYLLIEVLRLALSKGANIKLVMVGDGILMDVCKVLSKLYNLDQNIIFKGVVDHDEVCHLMADSFCYMQHSITTLDNETEGTPVSIMEASQAGLPVISTIHGGIPDIIVHEETGFLVEENDIERMGGYLLKLYYNRDLAKAMGIKGKIRISSHFSLAKHIAILNSELESVVNED